MSLVDKIKDYLIKNPTATNKEIATALGTTFGYVKNNAAAFRRELNLPSFDFRENKRPSSLEESHTQEPPLPQIDLKTLVKAYFKKNDAYSLEHLSDKFNVGVGKVRVAVDELIKDGKNFKIDNGYVVFSNIIEKSESKILDVSKLSSGFYRFGVTGDNHLCSRYERLDVLNSLYDIFYQEGIDTVYNTGNWIDGEAKFNKHDLKVHGLDNQINYWIDNFPQRKGINTHYITGDDHEGWYTQREGINVGKYAEQKAINSGRNDLLFLGHMEADVILKAPNGETVIRVLHPGGGSSYAISYTSQKIVESYTGNEKPNILLDGHYHKAGYNYIRGVHVIQTACFTANTKIKTINGNKQIRKIKVGDLVLTHKNRYRKVTYVYPKRLADDFYRLNYGRKNRPDQTITATSEHPFLVERNGIKEWVKIRDIKAGDYVFVVANECEVTKEKIPYWMKLSKNANPMHKKEVRDKLSKTKGGFNRTRYGNSCGATHMGNDIIPFCEKMQNDGWQIVPVGADVIPDAVGFKDGKIVLFELEKQQGNYLEFKKDKYNGHVINKFIDEIQWVNTKEHKEQPRSFYEADDNGFIKVEVLSCEVVSNENKRRKRESVYNFEVEEDNSYVAGNVVVHNCTQDQTPFMRKKKLAAHLGGWIIELAVDDNGAITRFKQEFIPYYDNAYYERWNYKWK